MCSINGDVGDDKETVYDQAAAAAHRGPTPLLTDEDLADPDFCRVRFQRMADELDQAKRLIAGMTRDLQKCKDEHGSFLPPPEVQRAMTVRTGSMRSVLASVQGEDLVIVAPPGGFDDPEETWRRIVRHYGPREEP